MPNPSPVGPTDKLYIVTRSDLSPGQQAVQACHAMRQFTFEFPETDRDWFEHSNHLALLATSDLESLKDLMFSAWRSDLKVAQFNEPDLDGELTAIAIEPHPLAKELCRSLPLALRIRS
jgi:peptidyl-tRNA hydrolase